jgi:hypothetical protein
MYFITLADFNVVTFVLAVRSTFLDLTFWHLVTSCLIKSLGI